jgi:drug/metabolite transporter (DMT)-like permease
MNRPLLLLLGTGTAYGIYFPIGKLAMAAGVNPALWAALISLGGGLVMLLLSQFEPSRESAPVFRFSLFSGLLSYVVPNFLVFSAIPHIGSGLAAILVAMSPVTTAFLSLLLRVRPPDLLGLAGIAIGLAGAVTIIVARNVDFSARASFWLMLAALIPVFLGLGNVYRSLGWPKGASPTRLAALTNLAAVLPLLAIAWAWAGNLDLSPFTKIPGLVALQVAISSTMFVLLFRLQQAGGPTYLSQLGYVAAIIGAGIGVFYFHDTYPLTVWLGAVLVACGIALTTVAQSRTQRR